MLPQTEFQRGIETDAYRWLTLDATKGAPFTTQLPIMDKGVLPQIMDKSILAPYSRWTVGRKSNPNFSVAGSGMEGHLCAFTAPEITSILDGLQNDAFRIIKQDVGIQKLSAFLENESHPAGIKLLMSARMAFEIVLAKARAMRGMVEKGGYYYNDDNQMVKVANGRRERSTQYQNFVYQAPPVVDWKVTPQGVGVVEFSQELIKQIPTPPIATEFIGGDIGSSDRYKLLAELGRVGHPIVPIIRNSI
ncbi:MAG: hypothetical protein WAV30_02440 [Microgenomates group bacterium]